MMWFMLFLVNGGFMVYQASVGNFGLAALSLLACMVAMIKIIKED